MVEPVLNQQENGEQVINLRRVFWAIYRHRWLVLGVPALTLLFALGYLRTAPRIYEATSIVRVQQQGDLRVLPPFIQGNLDRSQQISLKTVERLVRTRLTVQQAIQALRQESTNHVPSDLLDEGELLKLVRTKGIEPDLVEISVRHFDPKLAALIANGLAKAMVQRFTEDTRMEASQERRYIEQSLRSVESQLNALEARIAQEKKRLGVVDVLKETEALVNTMNSYKIELRTAQAQRDAAEQMVKRLSQQIAKEQPLVSVEVAKENPLLKQMREQLVQAELERAQLLARYTPDHIDVQQVEERLQALKEALSQQVQQLVKEYEVAPNPAYELVHQQLMEAETERFTADAKVQALSSLLTELRQRLATLPDNQRRVGDLMRQAQTMEQVYTNLLMRLEDARIREAARLGDILIADLATVPKTPVSPRPLLTIALAVMLGLLIGVGLALTLEALNDSVETPDEIQRLIGVPILSVVPKTRSDLTHEHIFDLMASRRASAEAIRLLRTNLKFLSAQKPFRSLLVTSTAPGEGKTFISTALAIAWAQAGHPTILVDFDLRHPQIHECLDLQNDAGLTNLLVGTMAVEEVLQTTPIQNFRVITSGPLPPSPTALLETDRARQVLDQLKTLADIVILDTPPILSVSDTSLLVSLCDSVLTVIEAGKTPRIPLRKLKEQIDLVRGHLLGGVLNKVSSQMGGGYYYRYYGYGGYYYHRYYGEGE